MSLVRSLAKRLGLCVLKHTPPRPKEGEVQELHGIKKLGADLVFWGCAVSPTPGGNIHIEDRKKN